MIAARVSQESRQIILLVLEPGNIEKLKAGEPIFKFLNEFMPELKTKMELVFAYTPDAVWVAKEVQKGADLLVALEQSLTREPVYQRPKDAEDLNKIQ